MYLLRTRFAGPPDYSSARYIVTSMGSAALPDGRKQLDVPFNHSARGRDHARAAAETFARAVSHGEQWVEYMGTEDGDVFWLVMFRR